MVVGPPGQPVHARARAARRAVRVHAAAWTRHIPRQSSGSACPVPGSPFSPHSLILLMTHPPSCCTPWSACSRAPSSPACSGTSRRCTCPRRCGARTRTGGGGVVRQPGGRGGGRAGKPGQPGAASSSAPTHPPTRPSGYSPVSPVPPPAPPPLPRACAVLRPPSLGALPAPLAAAATPCWIQHQRPTPLVLLACLLPSPAQPLPTGWQAGRRAPGRRAGGHAGWTAGAAPAVAVAVPVVVLGARVALPERVALALGLGVRGVAPQVAPALLVAPAPTSRTQHRHRHIKHAHTHASGGAQRKGGGGAGMSKRM